MKCPCRYVRENGNYLNTWKIEGKSVLIMKSVNERWSLVWFLEHSSICETNPIHATSNSNHGLMYDNKVREIVAVNSATYLIPEYHCGRLKSTPLGKLCTDASA
jgi:hypothetical protein